MGEAGDPAGGKADKNLSTVKIVDTQDALVPEAKVTLQEGAGAAISGVSDGRGLVRLAAPAGRYLMTVSRKGFAASEQMVDVPTEQGAELTVVLKTAANAETVEVEAEGYRAADAVSATRMPMGVLETPQQVQVLTGELLQARTVESMKEAVEMVPAVGLQLGEGRRDNFFIRGFNAVDDMYLDGVRDDAQYYRDLSNTERIEVVEGPAAVLYGRGSSGGLINRITKKPEMEGTLGELSYTAGSYGEQRGTGDVDVLVPGTEKTAGFRLTGAGEHEGSQRHFYWMDRYTFAPTMQWQPSNATTVRLGMERLRDDRLPDRGIPFLPGADGTGGPAPVAVGNFYGYVGPAAGSNFIHSSVTGGTLDVKHAFEEGWTVHAVARKAGYSINFENMYATNVTPVAGGDYLVGRGEYDGTENWDLQFLNLEAYRTGRWLGMNHTVLVGTEYDRETTDSTQYNGPTNQTPVSLLHPLMVAPVLSSVLSRNNRFFGQTAAVYGQDLVQLAPRWKALVGVRLDNFRQEVELRPPTNITPNPARTDTVASPRVGVVYQAAAWAALYGNYSRTFDPSGENLSLATNAADLKPEVTQNYETGGKFDLLGQKLLATASLFRLDRTNIKTTDPNNPLALLNLGEQRTDGAEVGAQGRIARGWMLYGGYAWLDGRIVSSTTTSSGVSLQGKRPAMSPLHGGSVWTSYSFRNGFGMAGGVIARSVQFASTDNLAKLPAYGRLDVSAFYRTARYEVQANLQNVGDVRYYDAAQSDYQIYPSAPVNGTVTVRYRF
jgi:catecholate siderophore receptor